jgi:hypothetical protein
MHATPSKSDVRAQLRQTADAMSGRLDDLREEITSTGSSVREWMVQNPMASVGGMLATGLAVGLLFGGGSKRRRRKRHAALVESYLDALLEEAHDAAAGAADPDQALKAALRDRVPLVVYSAPKSPSRRTAGEASRGFLQAAFRETLDVLLHTTLSIALREVLETALDEADVEGSVARLLNEDDPPGASAAEDPAA